jgi:hypothetical protein
MALTQVDQGLLGPYAQYTGFKNRIINGAMMIDQRNAGASFTQTTTTTYTLDRWAAQGSVASKYTVQQNAGSVTPPSGFIKYLGITSSSAYTVGAGEAFTIQQSIEGLNVADLGWGAVGAATVTLSFRVYSSLTGTFGGALRNAGLTRSYPFTYSVPVANTWTAITVTVAGDTTGTWATDNTTGINIVWGLGVGATYSGTSGTWAGTNYNSATGATSVVGTNGATFYITGVQLEKGSTATSFDYRPYGTELALCQRYYEAGNQSFRAFWGASGVGNGGTRSFKQTKRATPTVIATNVTVSNCSATTNVENITTEEFANYHTSVGATGILWYDSFTASSEL